MYVLVSITVMLLIVLIQRYPLVYVGLMYYVFLLSYILQRAARYM